MRSDETVVYDLGDGWKAEFTKPPEMTAERVIARLAERLPGRDWNENKFLSAVIRTIVSRVGCWHAVKGLRLV